jgi:pimeloyl-ACP methyl ester carboxylesterase
MTAVFVHGVPETAAVWGPLVAALPRDDMAVLSLPGFGSPLPAGFEPTKERYAAWLAEALADFDTVDLVSHDWGGLLALRVLADQPANVRTWATDVADLDADHRWHDHARRIQTPGEGEALMEQWLAASADDSAALLEAVGAPADAARTMAETLDATMAAAVIGLYRSAMHIGAEWGPGIDRITAPGLVVESVNDPFRSPRQAARLAERTGATRLTLDDCGHWWMVEAPERSADALMEFWATAP